MRGNLLNTCSTETILIAKIKLCISSETRVICSTVSVKSGFLIFSARSSNRLRSMTISSKWFIKRSEEHTSELQSRGHLVCRLLLEKKKNLKLSRSQLIYSVHNKI